MAVTQIVNPQLYASAFNEMVFTASSTNSGQDNFKYLVDIYINGAVTYEVRLRIPAEPDNAYAIVDVHRVLEAYLSSNLGDNTGVVATTGNDASILTYQIKWGESYGTTVVDYADLTIDSLRYAWNGARNYPSFIDQGYLNWMLDDSSAKFLTNAPLTTELSTTDSGWLYFLHTGSPAIQTFEIKTYDAKDAGGSLIGTWALKHTLTFATTDEYLGKVTSAPISITALPNTEFSTGVQPVFAGTELSYTIQALDSGSSAISELRVFNLVDACKYPRQTVHFLNELGGFDVKGFNLARTDSYEITKEFYHKTPTRITSLGNYPYSLEDRQKTQYYTKSAPKVKLISDWISEEESIWLRELVESPTIYIEDDNNDFIACHITTASYDIKTEVKDKLFNLEIELELSYNNYRQRG